MDKNLLLQVYQQSHLTRQFEDRLMKLTMEGYLPPTLHAGAGQEVPQTAAIAALNNDDPVLYAHRGVAYMIARDVSLSAMLSDCGGRQGATNNGKGGIMHVVDLEKGIYGESGTLGGGMVVSVGMGMALKYQKSSKVILHFFGDGASNRGNFHESLNWAAVQKLPCVYICENNGWAVSVPASESTAVENIADRAAGYGIPGVVVDGTRPDEVYAAVTEAAARARNGEGPSLIEVKSIRLRGHFATDKQHYRPDAEEVLALDPLAKLRTRLIDDGVASEADIAKIEQECEQRVEAAATEFLSADPLPPSAAFNDVFA